MIPVKNQKEILEEIHIGHQRINKCLSRAKNSVHWFGITIDIERRVRDCTQCKINGREIREPLQMVPIPNAPWETVGTDIFQFRNTKYLIVVDYYSRYIERVTLKDERSITIVNVLKSIFARHGIPQNVISDNGRQFTAAELGIYQIPINSNI